MFKGQPIHPQTQQCILNLIDYFQRESLHGSPLLPLSSVQERVAQAMKVSRHSVQKIYKAGQPVAIKLTRDRKTCIDGMSEEKKAAIKDMINTLYAKDEKITQAILKAKLSEAGLFNLGKTSLRTVLLKMGYRWKQLPGTRSWTLVQVPVKTRRKTTNVINPQLALKAHSASESHESHPKSETESNHQKTANHIHPEFVEIKQRARATESFARIFEHALADHAYL